MTTKKAGIPEEIDDITTWIKYSDVWVRGKASSRLYSQIRKRSLNVHMSSQETVIFTRNNGINKYSSASLRGERIGPGRSPNKL